MQADALAPDTTVLSEAGRNAQLSAGVCAL
jgi:hypothetical protein